MMALDLNDIRIGVIGLGYVGLPLAVAFAERFSVIGYDIAKERIDTLRLGVDPTGEVSSAELENAKRLEYTDDFSKIADTQFIIVCVPTPVDNHKRPDLTYLLNASKAIGRSLVRGTTIVFESTVYPGCTEHDCVPVIERESGMRLNEDFWVGYSPERINPGDKEHSFTTIRKVVSASSPEALELVDAVYGSVVTAGTYRTASIQVAEAAKVIENSQRDLNIAFINELALLFHRLGIDVGEVLEAAGTKWNFLPFKPGLVGGHCIGVDPYYLTHKALEIGYHPEVILAGRRINDGMGRFLAGECIRLLIDAGRPLKGANVLILGLTFKENVSDIRNTRIVDIVDELQSFGINTVVIDPLADPEQAKHEYGIILNSLDATSRCDAAILGVAHDCFRSIDASLWETLLEAGAPILDLKGVLNRSDLISAGFRYWRLGTSPQSLPKKRDLSQRGRIEVDVVHVGEKTKSEVDEEPKLIGANKAGIKSGSYRSSFE
jgi:UDP-N-acetyl-D-galactosamine dehydrogenase